MRTDSYGNALSTTSDAAVEAFDRGVRHILESTYGAREAFETAVAADPDFALGHIGVARALMGEARGAEAKEALGRAQALTVTERERDHIAIVALVLAGKAAEARGAVRAHVRTYPRDVLIAQLCVSVFGLIGFSGEVAREADLLAYTTSLLPHYEGDWWMLTSHAISLCETGQITASREMMERALELNPANANAAHFKAHALYEDGETALGRAFLDDWTPGYDPRGNMNGHLTWHRGLWALVDGDTPQMWAILNDKLLPGAPEMGGALPINTLTDTVSLLHRATLAGHEVPPGMWQRMSDYAAEFFPQPGQSFADFHAALAHAMAGDGERLARLTETTKGFAGDIVAPLARAFGNMARGNWQVALDEIGTALPGAARLGGSRAQRDLIELTYTQLLLRLGHTEEARRTTAIRRPLIAPQLAVAG